MASDSLAPLCFGGLILPISITAKTPICPEDIRPEGASKKYNLPLESSASCRRALGRNGSLPSPLFYDGRLPGGWHVVS